MSTPARRGLMTWLLPLAVFLLCFTVRLVFIAETRDEPTFRTPSPGMDIDLHWQAASLLLDGATTDEPQFALMIGSRPSRAYWLACLRLTMGDSMLLHRGVNAVLGSVTAVLMFLLVQALTRRRWPACLCALIWICLSSLIYFDSMLHKSALELLGLTLLLHLLLDHVRLPRKLYHIMKGALIGGLLAVLFMLQANTFLYALVIFAYLAVGPADINGAKTQVVAAALLVLACALLVPMARRQVADDKYPWGLPQAGIHMRIGFHDKAYGGYQPYRDITPWPWGHVFQARLLAEVELERPLTPAEADRFFMQQSWAFVRDNPRAAAGLIWAKFLLFFNDYEAKGIHSLDHLKTASTLLALTPVGLGLLVTFAGVGIIRMVELRKYRLLWLFGGLLGAVLLANLLTFVSWRYRLHNVVPLMVFAAFGFEAVVAATTQLFESDGRWGRQLLRFGLSVVLPLALCAWLAYHPALEGRRELAVRTGESDNKASEQAEEWRRRLDALQPGSAPEQELSIERALLLGQLHRHTESFRLLKAVHATETYLLPQAPFRHLNYLLWLGEYDAAVHLFESVQLHAPDFAPEIYQRLESIERRAFDLFVKPQLISPPRAVPGAPGP